MAFLRGRARLTAGAASRSPRSSSSRLRRRARPRRRIPPGRSCSTSAPAAARSPARSSRRARASRRGARCGRAAAAASALRRRPAGRGGRRATRRVRSRRAVRRCRQPSVRAGTAILRRLLGDPRVPLTQLDAIVEWGLAAKRTAVWPSTLLGCTWGAWYELRARAARATGLLRPAAERRRRGASRDTAARAARPAAEAAAYEALLRRGVRGPAAARPDPPARAVHRAAHELGFDRHAAARDLDAPSGPGSIARIGSPR